MAKVDKSTKPVEKSGPVDVKQASGRDCEFGHVDVENALKLGEGPPGLVYNLMKERAYTQQEMAEELGFSRGFVWAASTALNVMRTGVVPKAHATAAAIKRQIRGFIRRHGSIIDDGRLGEEALSYLTDLADQCERVVQSTFPRRQAAAVTAAANLDGRPGVYVYTLPHYLNKPMKPAEDDLANDRTLFKVGMSSVDAKHRVQQQVSTGLPEPPMLLRIYECEQDKAADVERVFHRVLNAFDHNPMYHRGAGKEWFLSSLTALDELARVLRLNILKVYKEGEEEDHQ